MIFFSERQLHGTLQQYVENYHTERNHQRLENRLIVPDEEIGCETSEIKCRERLGGLFKYYYRDAA